ncbi:hypothetical protein BDK92_1847 [Micromonospora pisi]|uniref:Uncharacterized protein n=1 Tax=Micromonospora pisi TaxID=589240 RepID=A0A495JF91_9ACTN|nr:hypothetical protein [Micromonospora pisi]RKR87567.1 hypothetical protein BDK92_1847 [Micromonospora pisi]
MTTLTRADRRARVLDDPRFERYRNPRSRHLLAAGLIGVLAVEAGLLAVLPQLPTWLTIVVGALVVVGAVGFLGTLKAATRGVEELPEQALDERQAQIRGQVHIDAYRIGFGLFTTALAVIALWGMLDLPAPGPGLVTAAIVVPFHLALVLPNLVAAFRADI